MYAVFKREFLSYFRSPVGYVALALYAFLSGYLFVNQFGYGEVDMASEIASLRSFFVIIIPIITMGLFADDKKRGTEVLYYTNPLSLFNVVIGKFLAAFSLFAILFVNVIIHMLITVSCGGKVGVGVIGSIIVYFFLASLFIAIGIFASTITDSQVVSAIVSFVIILFIQLISNIATMISSTVTSFITSTFVTADLNKVNNFSTGLKNAIAWLDPFTKTSQFEYGIFSVVPLVYCFSIGIMFIYFTYRVLEKKRWAQG